MRNPLLIPSIVLLFGCSSPAALPVDAARSDAARSDAALSDAGMTDASATDATTVDASPLADASAPDAARPIDAATGDVTTIRIVYPPGHTITVRGAALPLSWTVGTAATELGGGVYELQLHGLSAPAELKPLLDDTAWSRGPNFHVAPGDSIEIAPHFTAMSGRVTPLLPSWSSTLLGNTRVVYAYLPAGYDENTAARFCVLYMHDGQNLFDPALAFGGVEWQVDETMDAASEAGRCAGTATSCGNVGDGGGARCDTIADTIVIGVANTTARIDEYTPTMDSSAGGGGRADLYLRALGEELRPMVDAMLRTRTARDDVAMMGSSLGGLVSAYAGVVHPETFGRIGAMSPSTWWDGRAILGVVATIPTRPVRALRVYVDSGDSGPSMDGVADTAELAAAYRAVGYLDGVDLDYLVQPGGRHSELYWAERLPGALAFLLPRRERPIP